MRVEGPMKLTIAWLSLAAVAWAADTSGTSTASVTFHKDVLPIVQANCQSCHRPGQIAPMSFLNYESTRPWAKAMKAAVISKKMPPWGADPALGHITNDRSLSAKDIDTIAKWADSGAPAGDAKDAPAPFQWDTTGWQIKPDVTMQGPPFDVPAKGLVEWMWVVVPSPFKEDTWVTSIELRPTNPVVTHHMCLAFLPHREGTIYNAPVWQDKQRDEKGDEIDQREGSAGAAARSSGPPPVNTVLGVLAFSNGIEECYEPGRMPADFRPYHAAKLIKAGSDIAINYHFTPNGTAVEASVQVGFTVSKEPPQRRYLAMSMSSPQDHKNFAIPANAANWESPTADTTFTQDVELVGMMPHMHVRGKDMRYELEYPDGRRETILSVPRYDFNWQIWYDTSLKVPKGTQLHVYAHFDNSANNKFNPNPNKTVYYGDMTWDEMMFPSFGVVVEDVTLDQKKVTNRGVF